MAKLIGLFVIVAIASSEAMLQFPLVDLGLPFPKLTQCSDACKKTAVKAASFFQEYCKEHLQELQLPHVISSCKCKITGVEKFSLDFQCTDNDKSEETDYIFKWTHPYMNASCLCELPNNPAEVAEMLSKQDRPAATCGKPPYAVNTVKYKAFTCSGSGEGKSNITMKFSMENVILGGSEILDLQTMQFYPYYVKGEIDSVSFTYDKNPVFQNSFRCLQNNIEAVTARLISAFVGWFWPCTYGNENIFFHKEFIDLANC